MARIITDYLDETYKKFPDKVAISDENKSLTFAEIREGALKIATWLIEKKVFKKPIAIYLDKSVDVLVAFMGCAYSGNFYSPLDADMPIARVTTIIDTLQPQCIITCSAYVDRVKGFFEGTEIIVLENLLNHKANEKEVDKCLHKIVDTDILYVLFTSGSTGVPKGVIISHRATISYADWAANNFQIDQKEVIGNQTPFYFSMSVLDIFVTLKMGCTLVIIPKRFFSNQEALLKYIADKQVNLIYWVPSALIAVANGGALINADITSLKKVLFAGEVMPNRQLNIWRKYLPNALFANLFGPTEVTDICTYYIVNRNFRDDEPLPIGIPCLNTDIIILDQNDQLITEDNKNTIGEICVRGSQLAYGYYNNKEKTEEVFVQNPLNTKYTEMIYRTGDLVKYNSYGEIMYMGRKDFQIKVSGYRIELGEIETAISAIPEVDSNCCLFDDVNQLIICIFTGNTDKKQVREKIKQVLPRYMMPHKYIKLDVLPMNSNGKIDRVELKKKYITNI